MPTPVTFNNFRLRQHTGNPIDLDTDTIKCAILDNTYTLDQTDTFWSDVSAFEVSGAGYTAGGETITGVTVALDGNVVEFIHNDITWLQNAGGFSDGRFVVWYKDTGNPSTSGLIQILDNGTDFGNVSGDLTLDASATTGVLNISDPNA